MKQLWFLCLLGLNACSSAPDTFGKLDVQRWRADRNGCNSIRLTMLDALKAEQQNLKGKSANEIGDLLGRPDVNQLADRNQKFYVYFLAKGPQCEQPGSRSSAPTVALRMSAMGVVTEVTYQNGMP